jgi:hypothetical protein
MKTKTIDPLAKIKALKAERLAHEAAMRSLPRKSTRELMAELSRYMQQQDPNGMAELCHMFDRLGIMKRAEA